MIRRLTAAALLLGVSGMLAACGTTGHSTTVTIARAATIAGTATSAANASGASGGPAKPLTRRQAIVFAHAVNLTAADVPGFTVIPREPETAAGKGLEREMVRCAGALSSNEKLVEVNSEKFKRGREMSEVDVSSEVSFARTPALAVRELEALSSAQARTCVSRYIDRYFKGEEFRGASISPVTITSSTPSAPGTTGSFGWQISIMITARHIQIPFYIDILGFVYGQAQVSLFSTGVPTPLSSGIQQRLFSLLLERAKAHRL
jgi:hypothetical protein